MSNQLCREIGKDQRWEHTLEKQCTKRHALIEFGFYGYVEKKIELFAPIK